MCINVRYRDFSPGQKRRKTCPSSEMERLEEKGQVREMRLNVSSGRGGRRAVRFLYGKIRAVKAGDRGRAKEGQGRCEYIRGHHSGRRTFYGVTRKGGKEEGAESCSCIISWVYRSRRIRGVAVVESRREELSEGETGRRRMGLEKEMRRKKYIYERRRGKKMYGKTSGVCLPRLSSHSCLFVLSETGSLALIPAILSGSVLVRGSSGGSAPLETHTRAADTGDEPKRKRESVTRACEHAA